MKENVETISTIKIFIVPCGHKRSFIYKSQKHIHCHISQSVSQVLNSICQVYMVKKTSTAYFFVQIRIGFPSLLNIEAKFIQNKPHRFKMYNL